MRLHSPRIAPLTLADCDAAQRKVLDPFAQRNQLLNIYTTLAHNPDALSAFLAWGGYVLRRSSLQPRERELVILRIGYLCRAGYEWAQHSRLGKQAGLGDDELARIKIGPIAEWSEPDRALLLAADELHRDYFVSDDTWKKLRGFLSDTQCMDLVFVVAHYTQVCMILNTFGIQLDAGLVADPDLIVIG
ncbi:MAG TPA: carboxymuconolactone decarboxylase family protein [Steroidobacteraceae bacterium]|nr:carboxymuconolactone decarboxylase family protein [Steroidobacteraceae bacterium]